MAKRKIRTMLRPMVDEYVNEEQGRTQDLRKYHYHPRVLELRIIQLTDMIMTTYGYFKGEVVVEHLCALFDANYKIIKSLMQNRDAILLGKPKMNSREIRRDMIFVGFLNNETKWYTATRVFKCSPRTLYRNREWYTPALFMTDEFFDSLDERVVMCGMPNYAVEATRFINGLRAFMEVFMYVYTPEDELRLQTYQQ